mgnify:CR=1 FL=1
MENKNNINATGVNSGRQANPSDTNKNLALYYGIGTIVIVILIIFVSTGRKNFTERTAPILDAVIAETKTEGTNTIKKVPTISYADALVKYRDARIQFDEECLAYPNNVTYKNGTSIMIDNRAGVVRTMKVGLPYTVKAYDFKIIKLFSTKLPETLLIDCDSFENVATILVQE